MIVFADIAPVASGRAEPSFDPSAFAANPHVSIDGAAPITWAAFVGANANGLAIDDLEMIWDELVATGMSRVRGGNGRTVVLTACHRKPGQNPSMLASKIIQAVTANGFTATACLASQLNVGRDEVVAAYVLIEAAGYVLHRRRGGIEIVGRPRLAKTGMTVDRLPGPGVTLTGKRMRAVDRDTGQTQDLATA